MDYETGLVSIIITTYKADEKLVDAIQSVMQQSYKNIELIIIDDNAPDSEDRANTIKMVNPFLGRKVKYICHPQNMNGSVARNTGLRNSNGEFVAFLDHDDIYDENRIEKCVNVLMSNKEYDGVYTAVEIYVAGYKVDEIFPRESGNFWKQIMLNDSLIGTGSNMFFRRKAVDETGYFDEKLLRYQDLDYMIRFLKNHALMPINTVLVKKRNEKKPNISDYNKFKANKMIVFEKYKYEIDSMAEEERKQYYMMHYKSLFNCAVNTGNKIYIRDASETLCTIRPLTWKEKISTLCPPMFRLNNRIVFWRQMQKYKRKWNEYRK